MGDIPKHPDWIGEGKQVVFRSPLWVQEVVTVTSIAPTGRFTLSNGQRFAPGQYSRTANGYTKKAPGKYMYYSVWPMSKFDNKEGN